MKLEKILILADDSPVSAKAVEYGFNLARNVGAKVLLLHVIEPESAAGNPDAGIFPDDALAARKSQSDDFIEHMQKTFAQSVETELRVESGDIQSTIVNVIADWNADLLIAGTHRRTGLSKLFEGSVAESIILHSPVPVLIVPGT